jgi:hypothetical protein
MKTKFTLPTLLVVLTLSLTSCTLNDDETASNNARVNDIELNEQLLQREGDTLTPNENEPIITKPRK